MMPVFDIDNVWFYVCIVLIVLLLYCCFLCIGHSFSCATCTCHVAVTYLDLFPPVPVGTSGDELSPSGPIFRIYFGIILVDFNFLLGLIIIIIVYFLYSAPSK